MNQGAGSEILTHYKEKWNHIHSDTGTSSDLCDEMYQSLQKLYGSMSNSHHIITMATEELNGLPDVLKNIEETSNKVIIGGVADNNNYCFHRLVQLKKCCGKLRKALLSV